MRRSLLALAALALMLAGCLLATSNACATQPTEPLTLELTVEDACAFFAQGTSVTLTLTPALDIGRIEAGLALPPGVHLLAGETERTVHLAKDAPVRLTWVARANRSGEHVLHAWAEGGSQMRGPGATSGWDLDLGVRGNATRAETYRPLVGESPFRVRIDHEPGNATRLVATVESRVHTPARVHLYFSWPPLGRVADAPDRAWPVEDHPEWTGNRTWQGDIVRNAYLEWSGTLTPSQPLTLRFHAPAPPEEGQYTVAAYVLPHARIDAQSTVDEAAFFWKNGEGRLVRGPAQSA